MGHHRRHILVVLASMFLATMLIPAARAQDSFSLAHVVQPGDTLVDLALFYGVTESDLAFANEDVETLLSIGYGQALAIPVAFVPPRQGVGGRQEGPRTYIVQRGDTLFRIAARFNVSASAIVEANGIRNIDTIYVGQSLVIPTDGSGVAALPDQPVVSLEPPSPTLAEGKQIVVVLSQQRTYAYEDGVLLRQFVISSGLPATPTVKGDFAVYLKYESQLMTGPGYSLPNVPWVMYFYRGYALHGTYWHDNFGQPMSHGCVNMRTPEAEWLYNWAPLGTAVRVVD